MSLIKENLQLSKVNPLYIMKVAIGSAISIIIAEGLGLLYSPSAGIVTLLSVQNTKKETIKIAAKRFISFLMAMAISFILFSFLGYNPFVFGGFILIFVGLSHLFDLKDGISMNAVLMTHFLIEERFDLSLVMNEVMILVIGMGIGIVINLIMPNYRGQILKKQRLLEDEIRKILRIMAQALKDKKNNIMVDFSDIDALVEELLQKAYEDAGNTLLANTRYLISYLEMRKHQIEVLKEIANDINEIPVLLKQSLPIAEFIENTADCFHELNNAKGLLEELDKLYVHYRQDDLPISREEFEHRAILFKVLKDLEYFLLLKRNFVLELEKKNIQSYWS